MIIENGKYKELTEKELTELYVRDDWDDVFSFEEFRNNFISSGCKIIQNENKA